MEPARIFFVAMASVLMLSGPQLARGAESTVTFDWMGAEVAIVSSADRAYGQPFDISFSVDISPRPPGDTFAFETFLYASDAVDLSGTTWTYTFISDVPVQNLLYTGVLGDVTTPTTFDGSGYSIRLYDPEYGDYTWLFSDYNHKVVWTLHDVVLLADADFDLTLQYFLMLPETFSAQVTPTPEPSTVTLLGLGLGCLAVVRRRLGRA
jgi:hypothetical protein